MLRNSCTLKQFLPRNLIKCNAYFQILISCLCCQGFLVISKNMFLKAFQIQFLLSYISAFHEKK